MAQRMQEEQLQSLDKLEIGIRHGFVRKVMGLLVCEVVLAMGVVCLLVYTPAISDVRCCVGHRCRLRASR